MVTMDQIKQQVQTELGVTGGVEDNGYGLRVMMLLLETRFELANGYKTEHAYDKTIGDDTICVCGHTYYRHFDSYNEMSPAGCKYCYGDDCVGFAPAEPKLA